VPVEGDVTVSGGVEVTNLPTSYPITGTVTISDVAPLIVLFSEPQQIFGTVTTVPVDNVPVYFPLLQRVISSSRAMPSVTYTSAPTLYSNGVHYSDLRRSLTVSIGLVWSASTTVLSTSYLLSNLTGKYRAKLQLTPPSTNTTGYQTMTGAIGLYCCSSGNPAPTTFSSVITRTFSHSNILSVYVSSDTTVINSSSVDSPAHPPLTFVISTSITSSLPAQEATFFFDAGAGRDLYLLRENVSNAGTGNATSHLHIAIVPVDEPE
jgi:hypothetical protein